MSKIIFKVDLFMRILPAILEENRENFVARLTEIQDAEWMHIDVSDEKFAPQETISEPVGLQQHAAETSFEVHLMVEKPWEFAPDWIAAGVQRVIFHYESFLDIPAKKRTFHINNLLNECLRLDVSTGLALKLDTDLNVLQEFSVKLDLAHLMAIQDIGYQGHSFDDAVLAKAVEVKENFPELQVAVDGGVDEANIQELAQARVDQVAVGSAIYQTDSPQDSFEKLKKYIEPYE